MNELKKGLLTALFCGALLSPAAAKAQDKAPASPQAEVVDPLTAIMTFTSFACIAFWAASALGAYRGRRENAQKLRDLNAAFGFEDGSEEDFARNFAAKRRAEKAAAVKSATEKATAFAPAKKSKRAQYVPRMKKPKRTNLNTYRNKP